ncbi:DUF4296 domain-containing protein [Mucilaginibacter aquariorum]|uniref:DUF4296 domain-containing protein n=1 Tax=Mucilaginibacter aquariorum TaxID=2967225 RepID=A0ABT1SW73_9SPHI|nr:DUF4296 domain-containing protein [Mucilaginibacter aquariorum]MCQ6956583.1 DUF4296 domain-containing protein [Mucilaginibacter aquariorum]
MQKYISLFFSVLLYLTACKSNDVPNGIIEEKEMISLLTDVHITDGAIYSLPQIPDSLYKYGRDKYVAVFKKHHTTDDQFQKSLKYYTTQPDRLQEMYNKIDVIIKAKIDSINQAQKKENDAKNKVDSAARSKTNSIKHPADTIKPVARKLNARARIDSMRQARKLATKARIDSVKRSANKTKQARKKFKNAVSPQ